MTDIQAQQSSPIIELYQDANNDKKTQKNQDVQLRSVCHATNPSTQVKNIKALI